MLPKSLVMSAVVVVSVASSASAESFPAGTNVSVEWKGTWHNAAVKSVDTAKSCWNIHYDGYEANWDECVPKDRIKARAVANPFPDGAKVQVLWKAKWYPSAVKSSNDSKKCWNIHYDGFEASWDECVGRDRIKAR